MSPQPASTTYEQSASRQRWAEVLFCALQRPVVVMSLLAALLATQLVPLWSPSPDAAGYLSIARSIAHGGPLANMGSPKLHYAPGYSLLISPAFLVADRPLFLLLAIQWLFAVMFMIGVYRWARHWFAGSALWITALTMSNVSLWIHARATISEMPFMALLVWTALAMDRLRAVVSVKDMVKRGLLVGAMTGLLSAIRPVGVLVMTGYGALVFLRAYRGQISWKAAIGTTFLASAPAAATVLALLIYEAHTAAVVGNTTNATYLHEFKTGDVSLPAQWVEGLRIRVSEVGRLLVPGMNKSYARPFQWLNANMLIYVPLFVAIAWSWCQVARSSANTLVMMVPCYLALYILYPSDQGTRYLLPMLPVLVVCLWWLVCHSVRHRARVLGGLVAAHLLVSVGYSWHGTARLIKLNEQWPAVEALTEAVRRQPGPAVGWNTPFGVRELAMVTTDWRYGEIHGEASRIPADAQWVITVADAPECPGFREQSRAGDLKLLARTERLSHAPAPHSR